MTEHEIQQWVEGIVLDLANVGSECELWRVRQLARRDVYEARGLDVPELRSPFWDMKPGQVT